MMPLDARKIRILQAVVQDFVDTSRPVGSERILEVYNLGCKSATVRYEMAEMSEMGYLAQPHTSSGRIPTDQGYRYFVNELMEPPGALPKEDEKRAQSRSKQIYQRGRRDPPTYLPHSFRTDIVCFCRNGPCYRHHSNAPALSHAG